MKVKTDNKEVENCAIQQARLEGEAELKGSIIFNSETIEELECASLNIEQEEVPVYHHFGPNIYIREVRLKAGLFAIGHAQKNEQMNVMLSGVVNIYEESGIRQIKAPLMYVGDKGRKVGYVVEDTVWLNIYSNPENERDIDKLEDMFLEKSNSWEVGRVVDPCRHHDIQDYKNMLIEYGISEEIVRGQSENMEDQMAMPQDFSAKISVRKSNIEGLGLFANAPINKGDEVGPGRLDGLRTPIGRYTNHSANPNCEFVKNDNDDIFLFTLENIDGCLGGGIGTELTVNYRKALELSGIFRGDLK